MAQIRIDSILNGEAPSRFIGTEGQYSASIGLDPDLPMSDAVGDRLPSFILRPSGYAAFDGANIDANPYWILADNATSKIYSIQNNGKIVSYSSTFGSETLVGTATSSSGNGAVIYNNYLYVATNTDISRYGPLDGTPSLSNTFWTSTLGLTALANYSLPSIRGSGTMPNHILFPHVDGKLYITDFVDGAGVVHMLRTKTTTDIGDTDNGSQYNVLDLPKGFRPTAIASYGNDIVIAAVQTTDTTLQQGKAALFFWNTTDPSFYNQVPMPDSLVTALLNSNGRLYIWSGATSNGTDVSNGYRVSVYAGGQTIQQIHYSNTGSPPLAGAVESFADRLVWGTFDQIPTTTASSPEYYAVVKALGSKNEAIPKGVHTIIKASATATAADGLVTALARVQTDSFSSPKFVVGWRDATGHGIDKAGTTYGTSVWRSKNYNIGRKFTIRRIRITLGAAVAANMTITPTVFLDEYSSSSTSNLTVVNNTNYTGSERYITWYPDISGDHDFAFELRWSGTALLPVLLPIEIDFDVEDD